jgi:magnesium-transporting ATPase (P-type)
VSTLMTQDKGWRQSRHCQHWGHKTKDEDNPETLSTLRTQDKGWRQSRDTVNIESSMLTVSLDCLHPLSCVLNVDSVSWLSSSFVLCPQCWQCLLIVFILCLVSSHLLFKLEWNKGFIIYFINTNVERN